MKKKMLIGLVLVNLSGVILVLVNAFKIYFSYGHFPRLGSPDPKINGYLWAITFYYLIAYSIIVCIGIAFFIYFKITETSTERQFKFKVFDVVYIMSLVFSIVFFFADPTKFVYWFMD